MPPDPPSRRARLRVREHAFTFYYHPVSPPPPNSKSCMKPCIQFAVLFVVQEKLHLEELVQQQANEIQQVRSSPSYNVLCVLYT